MIAIIIIRKIKIIMGIVIGIIIGIMIVRIMWIYVYEQTLHHIRCIHTYISVTIYTHLHSHTYTCT